MDDSLFSSMDHAMKLVTARLPDSYDKKEGVTGDGTTGGAVEFFSVEGDSV